MSEKLAKLSSDEVRRLRYPDLIEYEPATAPMVGTEASVPIYDRKHHRFAEIALYRGKPNDPHGGQDGDICHYRSIALGNGSMDSPHPDYIDIDMEGRVLRSWNAMRKQSK